MKYLSFLDKFSYTNLLIASALLGLAPFFPYLLIEKIQMLSKGELTKLIDIGDLVFLFESCLNPWFKILLFYKLFR